MRQVRLYLRNNNDNEKTKILEKKNSGSDKEDKNSVNLIQPPPGEGGSV